MLAYPKIVKRPSYNFVLGALLLSIYEILLYVTQMGSSIKIVNGVDAFFQRYIFWIPYSGIITLAIMVILGIYFIYQDTQEGFPLEYHYFVMMLAEAMVWGIAFFIIMPSLIGKLFPNQIGHEGSWLENMALSCGAGFYEELFFRLILVKGLQYLLQVNSMLSTKNLMIIWGSAFIFSLVHYIGTYGDAFTLSSFMYRWISGLFLNFIFVYRGFGIAAWSHAFYDMIVFTLR